MDFCDSFFVEYDFFMGMVEKFLNVDYLVFV